MKEEFSNRLKTILAGIHADRFSRNTSEERFFANDFALVDQYAHERGLINTAIALRAARSLHSGLYRSRVTAEDGTQIPKPYFCHCLSVCRMLINLPVHLSEEDEDIMLAAALCHDVPAYVPEMRGNTRLSEIYGMDRRVSEMVNMIYTRDCVTDEDFQRLFRKVSGNRIAILIKLADRGHVVESLYDVSVWRANEYIHETRTYYIPLCIYAGEYYPELDRAMGVLRKKLQDLTEATEIFVQRYTDLERELTTRILQLEEDNARMRTRIRKLKDIHGEKR